ncbi:hypothetical protein Peur_054885 [Populus x canadensis]
MISYQSFNLKTRCSFKLSCSSSSRVTPRAMVPLIGLASNIPFLSKPRNLSREEQQMHKSSFEKLSHAACGAGIFSLRYLKVRATTVTFTRFVPAGQARYDYRLTIFI